MPGSGFSLLRESNQGTPPFRSRSIRIPCSCQIPVWHKCCQFMLARRNKFKFISYVSVLQICDSLDYLEKVCNDVFTRVSTRVSENHSKLQAINERVNLAQAKIDKLKGSNKVWFTCNFAQHVGFCLWWQLLPRLCIPYGPGNSGSWAQGHFFSLFFRLHESFPVPNIQAHLKRTNTAVFTETTKVSAKQNAAVTNYKAATNQWMTKFSRTNCSFTTYIWIWRNQTRETRVPVKGWDDCRKTFLQSVHCCCSTLQKTREYHAENNFHAVFQFSVTECCGGILMCVPCFQIQEICDVRSPWSCYQNPPGRNRSRWR